MIGGNVSTMAVTWAFSAAKVVDLALEPLDESLDAGSPGSEEDTDRDECGDSESERSK
jgi:hypothetical protein